MKLIDTIRERHKAAGDAAKIGVRVGRLFESKAEIEPNQNGRMLISAVATTATVDLENEVVVPSGANIAYFVAARAVYYCHNTFALPVASLRNLTMLPNDGGWRIQASTVNTEFARDVATCVAEGAINGGSIGFLRIQSGEPTPEEIAKYGPHEYITRQWDWLEWSLTPMPCNPDAMVESVGPSKSLPDEAASAVSRLVARGRISRKSAEAMGLARRVIVVRPVIRL